MNATEAHVESRIEQLLEVLKNDLMQMQENMARLDSVRELVIKRDIKSLEKLLEEIKNDAVRFDNQDVQRSIIREQIAAELGVAVELLYQVEGKLCIPVLSIRRRYPEPDVYRAEVAAFHHLQHLFYLVDRNPSHLFC